MISRFNLFLAIMLCSAVSLFSQTGLNMPTPRVLNEAVMNGEATIFPVGQYSFTEWASTQAGNTYPTNMMFYTINASSDPNLMDPLGAVYNDVYNSTSSGKINGRGELGISMGNSGSTKLGAAVLALNTIGRDNINVAWSASTVVAASGFTGSNVAKICSFALQYRLSTTGDWITVPSNTYSSIATASVIESFTGTLPTECNNQSLVQLRWIYYLVNREASTSGSTRPRLGLDDISISSTAAETLTLSAPTLLLPADLAVSMPLSTTLTWNPVNNATEYKVQVSTANDFATTLVDEVLTATNKALSGLQNSTQYFWKVQAINGNDISTWSAVRSFTTQAITPAVPTLSTPADLSINTSVDPTLAWEASANATGYRVQVSTTNDFAATIVNAIVSTPTKVISGLQNSTQYFWKVQAINDDQLSEWSGIRTFTTIRFIAPTSAELNISALLSGLWINNSHKAAPIMIELRSGNDLTSSVLYKQVAGIISNLGEVSVMIDNIANGEYWLIVRATGYLPIASSTAMSVQGGNIINYDFTRSSDSVLNPAMLKLSNGRCFMKAGDLNADQSINGSDGLIIKTNTGSTSTLIPAL